MRSKGRSLISKTEVSFGLDVKGTKFDTYFLSYVKVFVCRISVISVIVSVP